MIYFNAPHTFTEAEQQLTLTIAYHVAFAIDRRRSEEKVRLSLQEVDTAVPCELIINELVSNCIKHAFPNDRKGQVCISLRRQQDEHVDIVVDDNGGGLPAGFDYRKTPSFGLQLVRSLTLQIDGRLSVDTSPQGTSFRITLPSMEPAYPLGRTGGSGSSNQMLAP
jgi:two-component sensor histidine kinase